MDGHVPSDNCRPPANKPTAHILQVSLSSVESGTAGEEGTHLAAGTITAAIRDMADRVAEEATGSMRERLDDVIQRCRRERSRRKEVEAENASLRRRIEELEHRATQQEVNKAMRSLSGDDEIVSVTTARTAHHPRPRAYVSSEEEKADLDKQWKLYWTSYEYMVKRVEEADLKMAAYERAINKRSPRRHTH